MTADDYDFYVISGTYTAAVIFFGSGIMTRGDLDRINSRKGAYYSHAFSDTRAFTITYSASGTLQTSDVLKIYGVKLN